MSIYIYTYTYTNIKFNHHIYMMAKHFFVFSKQFIPFSNGINNTKIFKDYIFSPLHSTLHSISFRYPYSEIYICKIFVSSFSQYWIIIYTLCIFLHIFVYFVIFILYISFLCFFYLTVYIGSPTNMCLHIHIFFINLCIYINI